MKSLFYLFSLLLILKTTISIVYANQPGSVEGEKLHIKLLEENLEREMESIEKFIRQRAERHRAFNAIETEKLRVKNKYSPYFRKNEKTPFRSPDDINKFSYDLIRGMDESEEFKLSKKKRDELLELATEADLSINDAIFFKFGSKITDMIKTSNDSKNLYETLLDLTVVDEYNMRSTFDNAIKNSVIPFEKREIGVGILSTKHQVDLGNGIKAWTTTFGTADPSDIKKRGVRDIVLDRFANEAYETMNRNRQTLMAAVIDKSEMEREHRGEISIGLNKINQDMKSIEVLKDTIGLAQKQIAYEGAFFAKLSDHMANLARTDAEDASLFANLFYNTTTGDTTDPEMSESKKQQTEKWNNWVKGLSKKENDHFKNYLGIESDIANNPLTSGEYDFSKDFITKDFEKKAFVFKQYDTEIDNLPSHQRLQDENMVRKVKAQKFYYENILRRMGLNFKYELKFIPIPKIPGMAGKAQDEIIAAFKKQMLKQNKYPIIEGNLIIGEFSWEVEDDPENIGKKRVARLGDPEDGEKYIENYNSYLLFRLEERAKWAKRFHDIAEQLKRAAVNIQALRIDGKSYEFDPISGSYLNNLIDSSLKSFDGGSFANLNEYYQSLEAAKSLIDRGLRPEDLEANLVIKEKLWKIKVYRANNEEPMAIMDQRREELNARKTGIDKEETVTREQ